MRNICRVIMKIVLYFERGTKYHYDAMQQFLKARTFVSIGLEGLHRLAGFFQGPKLLVLASPFYCSISCNHWMGETR